VVSDYKFLTFRLHLGQVKHQDVCNVTDTISTETTANLQALQKQRLKQPPLKIPAIDVGKTSGIYNLTPWSTNLEDTKYIYAGCESLNQYM
jgi:hypothetical protein